MDHDLMTYEQAAGLLQLKLSTLYSLVSKRRIPHIRLSNRMVRFSQSEIEKWLHNQVVEVAGAAKTSSARGGGRRA